MASLIAGWTAKIGKAAMDFKTFYLQSWIACVNQVPEPGMGVGAYNGSCSHDTSTLKEEWAALTAIESESLDRFLIGKLEKAHDEVTKSTASAQKESRPFPCIEFTEPPSRQSPDIRVTSRDVDNAKRWLGPCTPCLESKMITREQARV
jgi:hypothetical protein